LTRSTRCPLALLDTADLQEPTEALATKAKHGAEVTAGSLTAAYSGGSAVVNVSGASTVTTGDVTLGCYGDGQTGTLNVSGVGTQWNIDGQLIAGYDAGASGRFADVGG
jgi:hypothetical protein